jgi:hypothetical protein
VRNQVANVPGASVPVPFGGKYRQIMVYVDPVKLEAHQLSVMDVVRSVNDSNLILPAGDVTIGPFDYNLYTNSQLHYLECNVFEVVVMMVGIVASNSILIVEFAHRLIEDDAPRGGTICCPGSSSPDFNDFASNDYRTFKNLGTAARGSQIGARRNLSSSGDGRETSQKPYLDTR